MDEQDDYILYIIVNDDLGMTKGKIASQVGHLVERITERIMTILYKQPTNKTVLSAYKEYSETGRKKIVLRASQKDLEELCKEKDAIYIIDAGRTQVAPDSLTVVGFFPSNQNKKRFSKYKLQ